MSVERRSISVAIALLRNDLRVHDNYVLFGAHQEAIKHSNHRLLPVYCFDPRQVDLSHLPSPLDGFSAPQTHFFKFPRCSAGRTSFLVKSVLDLKEQLRRHGSDLLIRFGRPETVVTEVVQAIQKERNEVLGVWIQKEVTSEEVSVESRIEANLKKRTNSSAPTKDIPLHKIWHATLVNPIDLDFDPLHDELPDVFSEFRRKVEAHPPSRAFRSIIATPQPLAPFPSPLDGLGLRDDSEHVQLISKQEPQDMARSAFPFKGGESEALERLNDYCKNHLKTYKQTRNGLIGSDYSSKFAPWLANGSLSPRMIYETILKHDGNPKKLSDMSEGAYWLVFELLWRDYFRFVGSKYGNALFHLSGLKPQMMKGRSKGHHPRYRESEEWRVDMSLFKRWADGNTGVPFVDANMRELKETGFMSNRGRQNVASFLVHNMRLDWRLGGEWFESLLLDYDTCSNYGNWTYVAGVGNDPRGNGSGRSFNVIKQAKDYDPFGEYVKLWCPELAHLSPDVVHTPWVSSLGGSGGYPSSPIVTDDAWKRHQHRAPGDGAKTDGNPSETVFSTEEACQEQQH
eukprot:TRINITY_DN7699_c0_g1_i1.p1 TRINITY_DN7699_c0_g1~~TRINITY_DN7699_c0_g1_i1.p1  ORF type:complete len:569 (+),score=83.07 TRINITY_DN7699_c0_g1_i1:198-1904(+)